MINNSFVNLLIYRTIANLRTEVSRYYLNYLWWALEPLLTMAVFYVVFGIFLGGGKENFAGFLLVGLTSWNWFNRSIGNASTSILGGCGLMQQLNISKTFFPLEVFLRDLFKQLFVVGLLLTFLIFYPTPVSASWFALPLLMITQATIILGAAILVAAIIPFLPDLKFIVSTGLLLMFFGSGIFFAIDDVVLEQHRFIMYLNPMAGLIKNYREVLIYAHWPDWWYLFKVFLAGVALIWFSLRIVKRNNHIYPRLCQ